MTVQTKNVRTHHHLAAAVRFDPAEIKRAMSEVEGFNARVAVLVTHGVGSMACAWIFCLIALTSLPAILVTANVLPASTFPHFLIAPGLILIVAWIAQTFIQLVLLSIILVGQSVQSLASDARSERTFTDTEKLLDAMDVTTAGGLKVIADQIDTLGASLAELHDKPAKTYPGEPELSAKLKSGPRKERGGS